MEQGGVVLMFLSSTHPAGLLAMVVIPLLAVVVEAEVLQRCQVRLEGLENQPAAQAVI